LNWKERERKKKKRKKKRKNYIDKDYYLCIQN